MKAKTMTRIVGWGLPWWLALAAISGCDHGDARQPASTGLTLARAFPALTFAQPVLLLQNAAHPDRWYVVERAGRVLRFQNSPDAATASVLIDLRAAIDASGEGGLLGMAFHPDFSSNGFVFLHYTARSTLAALESRISRFTSRDGGLTVDPGSELQILRVDQPFANHNGGHIAFGSDGLLYIGLGDGGSAGDPQGHGQNTGTLLGAILRIDVNGSAPYALPPGNPFANGGGRGEIFAWGLRNPWRWGFDRATGALWAGDVGQGQFEEVDVIESGKNYGWNVREGAHCFGSANCSLGGLTDPVAEYSHSEGCSITGGYVYRGNAISSLNGVYVYGDFCSGRIWGLDASRRDGSKVLLDSGLAIVSFAEALDGELMVLDFGGGIYRLLAQPS